MRLLRPANAGPCDGQNLRLSECEGKNQMQVGMPFLEGRDRAERKEERHDAGFTPRSVPLEYAMESHKQRGPDEVRELV